MTRRLRGAHVAARGGWRTWLKVRTVWLVETDDTDPDQATRFWFPLFDVFMIALGIYGVVFGSPILHRLFPAGLVDLAGVGITTTAAVALVGVVFPRLGILELTGKLGIVFLLGCYITCVALFPADPSASNGFLVILLTALLLLVFPRIRRLLNSEAVRSDARRLLRVVRWWR